MTTLAEKLQIKPAMKLVVVNAPASYIDQLTKGLKGINLITQIGKEAQAVLLEEQAVLLFVTSLAEAEKLAPEAVRAVRKDGLVWIAYPKGGSGVKTDVNRDKLWPVVEQLGWRPVRMVALDETWSAMRFRPVESVKGKK